jgi:hypothetical protein
MARSAVSGRPAKIGSRKIVEPTGEGTGLGLSIAYDTAARSKSTAGLANSPNSTIRLPRSR